ncbi:MAG: hypothetical protein AB1601_02145 [Planctomycetota bacterium]
MPTTSACVCGVAAAVVLGLLGLPPASLGQGPIIIDHTSTNLAAVPPAAIEQAKLQLKVAYGHTSHGSQPISGMNEFKNPPGSLYWWDRNGTQGGLSLWDGTPTGDLGNPDRVTWAQLTREMLNGYGADRNVVVWSWCGQADTTPANIQLYLDLMAGLINDYPNVKFVYMTGHLNGTGATGNLHLRNEQIRAWVRSTGGILFDFADIESYDPDYNYFLPLNANDNCDYWIGSVQHNWAVEWCAAHPGQCSSCSCAHSQSLNCDLKGRAFWWMLARLAGWPGPGGVLVGDVNCDGHVDFGDINPFVLAMSNPAAYAAQYPNCPFGNRDINNDGKFDFGDINPFVTLLAGP